VVQHEIAKRFFTPGIVMTRINVLFDIGHPAHFHLFKHFIHHLHRRGIPCTITTRDKDVTNVLVDHEGFAFTSLSTPRNSLPGMFWEMMARDWSIYRLHRQRRFTHAFGTSVSIAHLSAIGDVKSYNFCEDDDSVIPLQAHLIYPFTTKIVVPCCVKYTRWKTKRIVVPSYHELAYLHPDNFVPRRAVVESYGLVPGKYAIIRLSALKAHHDLGIQGISITLLNDIKSLFSRYGFAIVESSELKREYRIQPWDLHHVIANAKMIVSDSQTMAAEAMVLGVPSVRINTFVGKISCTDELENAHGLGFGYYPSSEKAVLSRIEKLLRDEASDRIWSDKRARMLSRKIDLSRWMIEFFTQEANA
jgi:predicted glycosyltransferase